MQLPHLFIHSSRDQPDPSPLKILTTLPLGGETRRATVGTTTHAIRHLDGAPGADPIWARCLRCPCEPEAPPGAVRARSRRWIAAAEVLVATDSSRIVDDYGNNPGRREKKWVHIGNPG